MRSKIHPTYYSDTQVQCKGCGHSFTTGSTKKHIEVEVCSNCHPFYTGEQKFIDTKGLVEKFQRKQKIAQEIQKKLKPKKQKKQARQKDQKSLKELLQEI